MISPRALAHNKFLVVCASDEAPLVVWTGSTNWTKSGLCTQSNNGILVQSASLAQFYLDQCNKLAKAGDATPLELYDSNAVPRTPTRRKNMTLWFTPLHGKLDLDEAGSIIKRYSVCDVQSRPARNIAQRKSGRLV
jgi:hypothetical protein